MKHLSVYAIPVVAAVVLAFFASWLNVSESKVLGEKSEQQSAEFERHREDDRGKHLEKSLQYLRWSSVYGALAGVCGLIVFLGCGVLIAFTGIRKALRASEERIAALERELQAGRANAG